MTDEERLFSILTQLIGSTVFGFIIGNMASMLENMDIRTSAYKKKMTEVKEYMVSYI